MTRVMTKYKYDAFISYRHTELDKYTAELLHRQLEAFRLPGNLAKKRKGERTRISRVFRDKDELPLTNNLEDPIMQALQASEYLIVICSPRLRESLWCRKEIETFISMHGREKVLAVLIEGEPGDSFPEELLYREETVTDEGGNSHVERIPMEPLAADIRGKDKRAMKKALRTELLRLLAPMFNLNYDDLRQRHRERRLKRILAASVSVGAVCLAFGAVSTTMALRIRNQNVQIQAQAEEILQQNEAIQQKNQEITEQNEALLVNQAVTLSEEAFRKLEAGDRIGAVQTAVSALTAYQGSDMPYTPEAQFALTESLHIYDNGSSIKPMHQMETAGIISGMKVSKDGDLMVTYDYSQCLTVWEIATGKKLKEFRDLNMVSENSFILQGSERLIYINDASHAVIYDIASDQVIQELEYSYVSGVYGDEDGKHLVLDELHGLRVLSGTTFEEEDWYEIMFSYGERVSSDGIYLAFQEEDEEDNRLLHIWNMDTGEKYPIFNIGQRSLKEIQYRDDVAYILLNDNGPDVFYVEASLLKYRFRSGEVLWEYHTLSFGSDFRLPYVEGASRLALATTYEGILIEMEDGSEVDRFPYGSEIAGMGVYTQRDAFLMFTRSGEYHMMLADEQEDYYFVGTFLSHSQNVKDFGISKDGFLLLPYQDNKVTYYANSYGAYDELEPIDGEDAAPLETESYYSVDGREKAEELGLIRAALVQYLFYDPDKSKVFVYYTDDMLEVYDAADMSLINTITEVRGTLSHYVGTDDQGNIYIAGYSYGYMLDDQCRPLAVIEGLVNIYGTYLEVEHYSDKYYVPIYSVEELLAKAAEGVL